MKGTTYQAINEILTTGQGTPCLRCTPAIIESETKRIVPEHVDFVKKNWIYSILRVIWKLFLISCLTLG